MLVIVNLTYFAMAPAKSTVVFGGVAGRLPGARANSKSPSFFQFVPSVEYSTLTFLAPKPSMTSRIWLEFHTNSRSSLYVLSKAYWIQAPSGPALLLSHMSVRLVPC